MRLVNEDSSAVTTTVLSTQENAFIIDAKRKSQKDRGNAKTFKEEEEGEEAQEEGEGKREGREEEGTWGLRV